MTDKDKFKQYLSLTYGENIELHERFIKDNDLLAKGVLYNGEKFRIKSVTNEVMHWCKV